MKTIRQKTTSTSMTSKDTKSKYKCSKCQDSKWIYNPKTDSYTPCSCVQIDHMKELWKNFGIKSEEVKKINNYDQYDKLTELVKDAAINYVQNFDDIRTLKENSFGLFGQSGAGKSHIAIALGAALLNRQHEPIPTIYMPYIEAMRELKSNVNDDEYYLKLLCRYSTAKLLIIDDLFKDKIRNSELISRASITEADMKHIYPILNYRCLNKLPTIFSTECTPGILSDLDQALAGRILDSCGSNVFVFKGNKYNYRMKKIISKR